MCAIAYTLYSTSTASTSRGKYDAVELLLNLTVKKSKVIDTFLDLGIILQTNKGQGLRPVRYSIILAFSTNTSNAGMHMDMLCAHITYKYYIHTIPIAV